MAILSVFFFSIFDHSAVVSSLFTNCPFWPLLVLFFSITLLGSFGRLRAQGSTWWESRPIQLCNGFYLESFSLSFFYFSFILEFSCLSLFLVFFFFFFFFASIVRTLFDLFYFFFLSFFSFLDLLFSLFSFFLFLFLSIFFPSLSYCPNFYLVLPFNLFFLSYFSLSSCLLNFCSFSWVYHSSPPPFPLLLHFPFPHLPPLPSFPPSHPRLPRAPRKPIRR